MPRRTLNQGVVQIRGALLTGGAIVPLASNEKRENVHVTLQAKDGLAEPKIVVGSYVQPFSLRILAILLPGFSIFLYIRALH